MTITKEQIFAAAEALEANGDEATLDSVRKALGATATQLTDAMSETAAFNAWKTRKGAKSPLLNEPAPPPVAERVTQFGNELWVLALKLADERLAPERNALHAARMALEAKAQEARSETTALRLQLSAANEASAAVSARAKELENRATALSSELARANRRNEELFAAAQAVVGIMSEA